jgi:valyl-tRNA synthetase
MSELATHYEPKDVEQDLDRIWAERGYYSPEVPSDKPSFCITIPPPNVTGSLHMGHALTLTIQDILCRWKRMDGYNVLWQPGTDHAGIATQMVVERDLMAEEGKSRFDLGREKFIERTFEWKEEYRNRIVNQMRRMGASVDWSRERFTLDDHYCKAVRKVFVELYKEGLIYRDHRLVNWSPGIHTVLSDLEIDYKDVKGHLWYMRYPLADGSGRSVSVATTRPETMLGDTAVAVHPEDPRHADLIGQEVELPLVGRKIPIIGDAILVDLEFGTGAVKITPGHDPNDFETGKRHGLPMISIFDKNACLNDEVPEQYRGLNRKDARAQIVKDLEALGLLEKVEDHPHSVGHCQRTGSIVEPMLSTQWFVRIQPLADPAIEAVKSGEIRFIPKNWEKTYFNWMENIRDWCISRQLWWGHRIPVWICEDCGADTCEIDDPSQCASCGGTDIAQETDVLDTWFSSGLWPFATLGWPDETEELKMFYPNSVMETGFDIIFFWVARMIMMGKKFMGSEPFADVYLHAMVRDEKGDKMSKTKGNVIDPLVVIDEHGADAMRMTLAAMAGQGRDIKLSLSRVVGYRAYCNKIWNATRFVLMNVEDLDEAGYKRGLANGGGVQEKWITSELTECIQKTQTALLDFRFNDAASEIYQFSWHTYCDWYVELAKATMYDESSPEAREAAQATALRSLENILRLLQPFMPHLSEKLWRALPAFAREDCDMVIVAQWPARDEQPAIDEGIVAAQRHVNEVISAIRNIRTERGVPPKNKVNIRLVAGDSELSVALQEATGSLKNLCRIEEIAFVENMDAEDSKGASLGLVASTEIAVFIPTDEAGLAEERQRLEKAIAKIKESVNHVQRKLNNPNFMERAPDSVVMKEKEKVAALEEELDRYQTRLAELS